MRDGLNLCDVIFNITIEKGDVLLGADLVIYKLHDPNADPNTTYTMYLIHQNSARFFDLVDYKFIPATSSEWQVFNIDTAAPNWEVGENEFVLKLYVEKKVDSDSIPTAITCTEMSSLFILGMQPIGHESNIGSGDLNPDTSNRDDVYVPLVTVFANGTHPLWTHFSKRSSRGVGHPQMM